MTFTHQQIQGVNAKCENRKISFYRDRKCMRRVVQKTKFLFKVYKAKDGQSEALNNIVDGNDVFAV